MNDKATSPIVVWLAAIVLLLGCTAAYTFAYFRLSTTTTRNIVTGGTCRVYRSATIATMFLPASLVESLVTGSDVSPAWPGPPTPAR